jgi:hypothetical protein
MPNNLPAPVSSFIRPAREIGDMKRLHPNLSSRFPKFL